MRNALTCTPSHNILESHSSDLTHHSCFPPARGSKRVHYSKSANSRDSKAAWHQHNTVSMKCHLFHVHLSTKMGDVQATVTSTLH